MDIRSFQKLKKAWMETKKSEVEKQKEKELLESRGWHTWYNEDYWVHPKVVADPERQDYTNYGMSRSDAVVFETEKKKPISVQGSLFGFMTPIDNQNKGK